MWHRMLSLVLAIGVLTGTPPQSAAQSGLPDAEGSSPGGNFLIGGAVGLASGAVFGATAPESCCVLFSWSRGEVALFWSGIGAAGGGILGYVVGELGHRSWSVGTSALVSAAIGGGTAALVGAAGSFDAKDIAYYAAFGAGTGALVGAVVGLRQKHRRGTSTGPASQLILQPGAAGWRVGWRTSIGR